MSISPKTIRTIHDELEQRRQAYGLSASSLKQEAQTAYAESGSAHAVLEGHIAAFVAHQLPDLNTPAVATFNDILQASGIEDAFDLPGYISACQRKNQQAAQIVAQLTARHGSEQNLTEAYSTAQTSTRTLQRRLAPLELELDNLNGMLAPIDELNLTRRRQNLRPLTPETLSDYKKPEGSLNRLTRWLSDKAYRQVWQALDQLPPDVTSVRDVLTRRDEVTAEHGTLNESLSAAQRTFQALGQDKTQMEDAAREIMPDRQILNNVRVGVCQMILEHSPIFHAVTQAFPEAISEDMRMLHMRKTLFGELANRLDKDGLNCDQAQQNLDKSLTPLQTAIRKGKGSVTRSIDLSSSLNGMDNHLHHLKGRVKAARDIRQSSHNALYRAARPSSAAERRAYDSSSSYSSSNDMLLWYLIMSSDTPHGSTQEARASLLAPSLSNPPVTVVQPVDADCSTSARMEFDSLCGGSGAGGDFNRLSNDISRLDLDSTDLTSRLNIPDLSSITDDISRLSRDIGSSLGSVGSSWSSSGGPSYDGGGYSCGDSGGGGGDCGGGGGGGGCD